MLKLSDRERIVLSIDTSDKAEAEKLAKIAVDAGARFVKLGLELSTAESWGYCAELAGRNGLEWIADAKLLDIGNTTLKAANNITGKDYQPFGITMHSTASLNCLSETQQAMKKRGVIIFGVSFLTDIDDREAAKRFMGGYEPGDSESWVDARRKFVDTRTQELVLSGVKGAVMSALEVGQVKSNPSTKKLITLVPGTRSEGVSKNDQENVATPAEAYRAGADLLVIGRQVTADRRPAKALSKVVAELEAA